MCVWCVLYDECDEFLIPFLLVHYICLNNMPHTGATV